MAAETRNRPKPRLALDDDDLGAALQGEGDPRVLPVLRVWSSCGPVAQKQPRPRRPSARVRLQVRRTLVTQCSSPTSRFLTSPRRGAWRLSAARSRPGGAVGQPGVLVPWQPDKRADNAAGKPAGGDPVRSGPGQDPVSASGLTMMSVGPSQS